jgi:hypothetical protein
MMPTQSPELAALGLLIAQLVVSGAVGVVHARERRDSPRHIESATTDQCLVVHDATRCLTCALAHARAVSPAGVFDPALPPVGRAASPVLAAPRVIAPTYSGDARAPPAPQG